MSIGWVVIEIWQWIREVRGRRKAPLCEFVAQKKLCLGRKGLRMFGNKDGVKQLEMQDFTPIIVISTIGV